ncbi:MAG: MFS transporter [Lachnospiraceae bacterium]|nr:MFS transporter [Lachnospiraceae bacterium]
MKNILKLDLKYAASQIFYYGAFCAITGYASVYLLNKNFNNSMIGLVLALCNVLAVVIQPILASFVDKYEKIQLRNVISVISVIMIGSSIILYVFPTNEMLILIFIVCIFSMITMIMPLMNSLAFVFEKYGIQINYGISRGLGSVAYAVTSFIIGYAVEGFSPDILPLFYVALNLFLLIAVQLFVLPKNQNFECVKTEETQKEHHTQLSLTKFCVKYKKFIVFLFGFIFVYFAHTIINYFFIQMVTYIGGTSSDMGNAVFLAAIFELPTMLFFTKVSQKVNCGTLIKFSVIMFFVKHILAYFATNMIMIYLSQAMQMFAYALFIPASVYYVNQKIAASDQVKGQSMVTMAMTIAGVFASLIGGVLIDMIGIHYALLVGAVVSFVGMMIVCLTVEKV